MKPVQKSVVFYAFVLLLSAYFVYLHITGSPDLTWICREDGPVENSQAVLYFLSAVAFFYLAGRRVPSRGWYLFFGVLFFLMAGEEITWGQRIFGIATPETWAEMNVQKETNLHNLKGIHGHIRALGVTFVGVLCWGMPLLDRYSSYARKFFKRWALPVYPLGAAGVMLLAVLFMAVPRVFYGTISFSMDEVGELWTALSFFLFALAEMRPRVPAGL